MLRVAKVWPPICVQIGAARAPYPAPMTRRAHLERITQTAKTRPTSGEERRAALKDIAQRRAALLEGLAASLEALEELEAEEAGHLAALHAARA